MDRLILIQEEPRNASELVEVPVAANGMGKVPFPDNQQLRSLTTQAIRIQGIRLITLEVSAKAVLSVNPNAPLAELQKCFLVLYCEGWEKAHLIPLLVLNDTASLNGGFPMRYAATKFASWQNVDWSKSFIQFGNGLSSANAPYTFLFDVEYTKLDASGDEIIGPS